MDNNRHNPGFNAKGSEIAVVHPIHKTNVYFVKDKLQEKLCVEQDFSQHSSYYVSLTSPHCFTHNRFSNFFVSPNLDLTIKLCNVVAMCFKKLRVCCCFVVGWRCALDFNSVSNRQEASSASHVHELRQNQIIPRTYKTYTKTHVLHLTLALSIHVAASRLNIIVVSVHKTRQWRFPAFAIASWVVVI